MRVGRLAPSPTGAFHLGNARTFLIAWLRVRAAGGRLLLRMEDLDHPKVKPGAVAGVYEDLRWLGLDWDEGPDAGGPHAPYVQTERTGLYGEALARLRAAGAVYPCTCTRRDVEAAQSAPHAGEEMRYPGTCRGRWSDADRAEAETGRAPCWRFRAPAGPRAIRDGFAGEDVSDLADWSGDFVVAKAGGGAAYQLAVVVDDHAMGVTEVVRADDLLPSAHRQAALYEAFGWAVPDFLHVPLVVGPDGRRLAKRHGDTRITAIREAGTPSGRVLGWLAASCGWAERGEELTAAELVGRFDLSRLPRDPLVVTNADRSILGVGE